MALPQPQPDDDVLVASILREIPEAVDEQKVRSLLSAWWRYAGVRAAAGAVVDSERFLAERGTLGLLELPVVLARSVIELEFALLHGGVAESPEPHGGRPDLVVVPEMPAPAAPVVEPSAPGTVPPADEPWPETPHLAAAVPVSAVARSRSDRRVRGAVAAERAQHRILAGLVVFFSLAIGVAVLAARVVPALPFPGGDGAALAAPWRGWLAVLVGAAGTVAAARFARRSERLARALAGPRLGLGGLTVTGLGVLAGSAVTAGLGAAVLVAGAAFGTHRPRT